MIHLKSLIYHRVLNKQFGAIGAVILQYITWCREGWERGKGRRERENQREQWLVLPAAPHCMYLALQICSGVLGGGIGSLGQAGTGDVQSQRGGWQSCAMGSGLRFLPMGFQQLHHNPEGNLGVWRWKYPRPTSTSQGGGIASCWHQLGSH